MRGCVFRAVPRRCVHVGQRSSLTRTFSPRDVELFSQLTGDRNPLHLDAVYAATTPFLRPVVHGVLVNGLLSALLGTRMPGPGCVLLHQNLRFPQPLYVGEEVVAEAEVTRVRMEVVLLAVRCSAGEKVVMEGEVKLMVPQEKT
ncbi:hydroxyacyl-thioester dehydratase type 2, mitochondrial-like [Gadus macrocephalus]|uniref:hydroxyacyl-thioester dehydratase type 2, mitochondrial-like n=1 Tax=Gadus macrocephalus TaxID=80720 RepID=UPI0028CBA134|nr:hydroxyacyl-thioester dehydratase type 2, mitochondrial-like [Gadus macrocephalus]